MKGLVVGILACLLTLESVHGYKVVCYFTNWSQYRTGAGKFLTSYMDANLCTHIIYSFAKLDGNSQLAAFEWNDESTSWSKGQFELVQDLRKQNPSLKVLLAVGGWNLGSGPFSDMVTNSNLRSNFVKTAVTYLKSQGFDGLDMDWEYPANREGSRPSDKQLFTVLLKELRDAFGSDMLLTAAVGAGQSTIDSAYEVAKIAPYLDFLNLMTYDFHGSWESVTGQNAPLYARPSETGAARTLNVNYSVNYWISQGFPASKIMLGMGTYGRSFTLNDKSKTGIGAPAGNAGAAGPYTAAAGSLGYYEICNYLNQGWTRVWDDVQKVPYAYKNDQWVGYDDVQSLAEKVNFLKSQNLGGAMFWSLDTDDFNGKFCNQGNYPLINGVKNLLNGNSPTSAPTKTTTTRRTSSSTGSTTTGRQTTTTSTTTRRTSTTSSSGTFTCPADGLYPNIRTGCQSFFQCFNTGTPNASVFEQVCPVGLLFAKTLKTCNWASQVTCS